MHKTERWAPKTFLIPDGRRVIITNLEANLGNTLWSCVFSLPWELSLFDNGIVRIKSVRELEWLRYNETIENDIRVKNGKDYRLKEILGDTIELKVTTKPAETRDYGVTVFCDKDNQNRMKTFYSADKKTISVSDGKEATEPFGVRALFLWHIYVPVYRGKFDIPFRINRRGHLQLEPNLGC